jgi:hypothetical protein
MERLLVVLVGGLSDGYTGERVRVMRPTSWRHLPARLLPGRFAPAETIATVRGIEAAIRAELASRLPGTPIEFLRIRYGGQFSIGVLSRRDPELLAGWISDQIASRVERNGDGTPPRIVLVAFSAGALLARRAMVRAMEASGAERQAGGTPWPRLVDTMVILSGITRGWQFTTATPAPLRFIGQAIRFLFPFDLVIWKLYRGSPFVVATRLAYADRFSGRDGAPHPPRTVFFLGSRDEFVTPSDCLELQPEANPVYLEIPDTTHVAMLIEAGRRGGRLPGLIAEAIAPQPDPHDARGHPRRSAEWQQRAADLADIDDYLDPLDLTDDHRPDEAVEHVVIVLHGIRDNGFWAKRISREIKTLHRLHHPGDERRRLRTVSPSYGFFSMWEFLFPGGRTRALHWFLDAYADIRRLYPRAGAIDLIAHSNGTYLGAQALRECGEVRFRRMLFAGSVVRRDFWKRPIPRLAERLQDFHNFIGRGDWIVALLPGAMETIPGLGRVLNVGGAGAFGFEQLPPCRSSQRMIRGGHGAAIQERCWKTIASWIVGDHSMEELLLAHDREDPQHPLRPVRRSRLAGGALHMARIPVGALIVPVLLIVLLFPLWYPMLVLADRLPTCLLPEIGAFGYLVLFVTAWVLRNALRHF